MITAVLIPNIVLGQDYYSINRSNGSTSGKASVGGISGSSKIDDKDVTRGFELPTYPKSDNERESRDHDYDDTPEEYYYSGPSNCDSWGENELNDLYEDKVDRQKYKDEMIKDGANSCLNEMNQLLADDCIDVIKIRYVIDGYLHLSNYQRDLLGENGKSAFEKLIHQLETKGLIYYEYYDMATNIRDFHFDNVDKEAMRLPYEDAYNKYLTQFLSKEEFEKAKVEYEKYENANKLKHVYEKIRNPKPKPKQSTSSDNDYNLAIQKVRKTMVDNYKVGAMAVKDLKEAQELLGNDYIPKSTLLDQMNEGINKVNESVNVKDILVKAFSGDWEEASSRYAQKAKEKLIDPLKDCAVGLGSSLSVTYETMKRVANFGDIYNEIVNNTWEGDKNAMNALVRGENPEKYISKASRNNEKSIKNGYKRLIDGK